MPERLPRVIGRRVYHRLPSQRRKLRQGLPQHLSPLSRPGSIVTRHLELAIGNLAAPPNAMVIKAE